MINKFDNKYILIWGYGREGKSTHDFLKRCCNPTSIDVFEGRREDIDEDRYDYIFKSPGIVMEEEHPKYTSQTQVFLEEYAGQTIGITGTKGKSTTATLLYSVLKECSGHEVILVGNIGVPCLDYLDQIDSDTIIVFEMSCHQLAHLTASPHIAVFLNLYEEHLDYYRTLDRYFDAKSHIYTNQTANDFLYVGDNVPITDVTSRKVVISSKATYDYELMIEGTHNRYNAEFVYQISTERYGCEDAAVKKVMSTFEGLSHRLQKVVNLLGVDYYDDSISTIPQATISAATSIENTKTLLIGGMDRGIDYSILVEFIINHPEYIYVLMYSSGKRIYDAVIKETDLSEAYEIYYVDDLEAAVTRAKEVTPQGYACILSPAAASYGYFTNFEERGDIFTKLVKTL